MPTIEHLIPQVTRTGAVWKWSAGHQGLLTMSEDRFYNFPLPPQMWDGWDPRVFSTGLEHKNAPGVMVAPKRSEPSGDS